MQRSGKPMMPFGKRGKRYTPPSFISKPKPLKSKEQLMEEIMLGTRDLPNFKKPLSANIPIYSNERDHQDQMPKSSPTPSTKSSVSTARTIPMSERTLLEPSVFENNNNIPPARVLQISNTQGDGISPLSTPLTSPAIASPKSRSRRNVNKQHCGSPIIAPNRVAPPLDLEDSGSPGVLSRKSRSRRAQPHIKTPVSTRRTARSARSLSDRRLQQMNTQHTQVSDPSIPPAPPFETKESEQPDEQPDRSATKAQTHRKSPVSSRRRPSVRGARSISDRRLQQMSTQGNQTSEPSIPSAPPLEAKESEQADEQPDPSTTKAQTHRKSPVSSRRRSSVRGARSISDRRLQQMSTQGNQTSEPSIPSAPPLETKESAEEAADDHQPDPSTTKAQTYRKSPVSSRRRPSVRSARSISDRRLQQMNTQGNDDSAQGQLEEEWKQDLSRRSSSSRETASTFKEVSTSTRSSSSHSLPTLLQSKQSGSADPKRRRKMRDNNMQRSRSGHAICSSEPKHPGFIKSFLGTSSKGPVSDEQVVSMERKIDYKDDEAAVGR